MPSLCRALILRALNLEGDVNVTIPEGRRMYYVFFRLGRRQISLSTRTKCFATAKENAAKIFADEVRKDADKKEATTLESLARDLAEIKERLVVMPMVPGVSHGPSTIKPLDEALAEFAEEKKPMVSDSHYERLYERCLSFVNFCSKRKILNVHEVKAKDCDAWIKKTPKAIKTRKNYLGDISNFLNWCCQFPNEWIARNPVAIIKRGRVKYEIPIILKVEKAASIMEHIERVMPEYACFYALSLFGGVRQGKKASELKRLAASVAKNGWAPYLSANFLLVPEPKVGPPRKFPLSDTLRAWIKAYPSLKTPSAYRHRQLIQATNLEYNAMRHTAISAYVCNNGSQAIAAKAFGTSETMIGRHYLDVMYPEEIKQFYGILPKASTPITLSPELPAPNVQAQAAG
jgi:integrase